MFEFSVAFKYLTPRWRQLSVSIISLISILVIALVVWLIVVFFSVTHGLEKSWIQKLIALTAPIRITPTENYYHSYYYQLDGISSASNYTLKTIGEKLAASETDPYDPDIDEEIPRQWNLPDRNLEGTLKDPVKSAFQIINSLKGINGLKAHDFEMTVSNLRLRLVRNQTGEEPNQAFLSQATYVGSLEPDNTALLQALSPLTVEDINNSLFMLTVASTNIKEDNPEDLPQLNARLAREQLQRFFESVTVQELKTPSHGWMLPKRFLPSEAKLIAVAVLRNETISKLIIPTQVNRALSLQQSLETAKQKTQIVHLEVTNGEIKLINNDSSIQEIPFSTPLIIESGISFPAELISSSLERATHIRDVKFTIALKLQEIILKGDVSFDHLEIGQAQATNTYQFPPKHTPLWTYAIENGADFHLTIPADSHNGDGILLPRTFKEAGTLVGDRGYLSYFAPTTSSVQEQRLPVYVAGFYDPGIIPIGGKYVLATQDVTSLIRASHNQEDTALSNGINIRFNNLELVDQIKAQLQDAFNAAGIANYWKIETYKEFDFTKDLIQQLHSERNLWTLIATVIIIVACSNIISMLIILVNDKKLEIGILRSMGASSTSIALIFGLCGMVMGMVGSILGVSLAILTLHNLQSLLDFITNLQGHELFNPVFYGNTLPNEVSMGALFFVVIATAIISLFAGLIPAAKASMLKPSSILRSE